LIYLDVHPKASQKLNNTHNRTGVLPLQENVTVRHLPSVCFLRYIRAICIRFIKFEFTLDHL